MHLDMDAFYASIEQVDHPELQGRPVIVGGAARGVVSTASYAARKYGVHSAMPIFQARRLCPQGIYLPVRMARYKQVSRQIMAILQEFSPLVEPVSIDEAYLDISGTTGLYGPPRQLAQKVKRAIREQTQLTCSIGIAPNKLLAKIVSDLNKPDGLTILEESQVTAFLHDLPVQKIPGIGAKTAGMLEQLGIGRAGQILRYPEAFWCKRLGRSGAKLYEKARGIDASPVAVRCEPKSYSAEDTFEQDTDDAELIGKWLLSQTESVGRDLRRGGYRGRTVTLKVKFADFKVVTRSRTLTEPTHCTQTLFENILQLFHDLHINAKVRLVGVGVGNLTRGARQTRLFGDSRAARQEQIDAALDRIAGKFGDKVLKRGRLFDFES